MTFKDIKVGYAVYCFDRNEVKVGQGKVTAVSMPHVQPAVGGVMNYTATQPLVVDVTIERDGVTKTYTIPEGLDVTYAGTDLVIATGKDGIVREVEAMKNRSEEALRDVDRHKRIVGDCESILTEWNPVFREKRDTEARFGKIESALSEMSRVLTAISEKMK